MAWRDEPIAICVCGPLASGKTTLARELATATGLPGISSGAARLHAAHLPETAPVREELHTYAADTDTYRQLGDEAATAVGRHGGAIVDATFLSVDDRAQFRRGMGPLDARTVFVECRAPGGVIASRLARDGHSAASILALLQRAQWEPLDELAASDHLVVRTDRPTNELVEELRVVLDERINAGSRAAPIESRAC